MASVTLELESTLEEPKKKQILMGSNPNVHCPTFVIIPHAWAYYTILYYIGRRDWKIQFSFNWAFFHRILPDIGPGSWQRALHANRRLIIDRCHLPALIKHLPPSRSTKGITMAENAAPPTISIDMGLIMSRLVNTSKLGKPTMRQSSDKGEKDFAGCGPRRWPNATQIT